MKQFDFAGSKQDFITFNNLYQNVISRDDSVIDVELFKRRDSIISAGVNYKKILTSYIASLDSMLSRLGENQKSEKDIMFQLIEPKIMISGQNGLYAKKVHTFAGVKSDGNLYYVDSANHFAFKLNGQLFHGNIGDIITIGDQNKKIKTCKNPGSCNKFKPCEYYHDPLHVQGSKDVRNYYAQSWIYDKKIKAGRKFGSLKHIDKDIDTIDHDSKNCFYDQTMHDILCALLLKNNS